MSQSPCVSHAPMHCNEPSLPPTQPNDHNLKQLQAPEKPLQCNPYIFTHANNTPMSPVSSSSAAPSVYFVQLHLNNAPLTVLPICLLWPSCLTASFTWPGLSFRSNRCLHLTQQRNTFPKPFRSHPSPISGKCKASPWDHQWQLSCSEWQNAFWLQPV